LNGILLDAEYIYLNFHSINSFKGNTDKPLGNQYKRFKIEKDVFTVEDYLKVRNNPYIYDYKGDECEIEKIIWDVDAETCEIDFRKNEQYIFNLDQLIIPIDGK